MEGRVAAPKRQHGPAQRHDLHSIVLDVVGGTQEPEPPAVGAPILVEVDEHGDDLGAVVDVNVTVGLLAEPAHRDRLGPAAQIDAELGAHARRQGGPAELRQEGIESRAVAEILQLHVAGAGDLGVIGVDRCQPVGADETGNDHVVEGIARQRRVLQRLQVEQVRAGPGGRVGSQGGRVGHGRNPENRFASVWLSPSAEAIGRGNRSRQSVEANRDKPRDSRSQGNLPAQRWPPLAPETGAEAEYGIDRAEEKSLTVRPFASRPARRRGRGDGKLG